MKGLVVIAAVLGLSSTAAAAVPQRINKIVGEHCLECHDGTHDEVPMDLVPLPDEGDIVHWMRILEMVESSRMPPPGPAGSVEKRFPLDPEIRQELVEAISGLLGDLRSPPVLPQHISSEVWIRIVRDFVGSTIPAEELDAILETMIDGPPDQITPTYQVALDGISERVCRSFAARELAKSKRPLLGELPTTKKVTDDARTAGRLSSQLYRAIFGAPPSNDDAARDRALLLRYLARTGSWKESWIGLCTTELSGPELQYLYAGS